MQQIDKELSENYVFASRLFAMPTPRKNFTLGYKFHKFGSLCRKFGWSASYLVFTDTLGSAIARLAFAIQIACTLILVGINKWLYCIVWYGMVWYGMVWYGMVWYGIVL